MSQQEALLWQSAIAAVVTIALAYMQMRTKGAVDKAATTAAVQVVAVKEAAAEVKQAAQDSVVVTATKLDALAVVADKTHELVNGGALAQMRRHAAVARKLADLTRAPADVREALLAEAALAERETKADAK